MPDYPIALVGGRTVLSDDPATPAWLDAAGLHLGGRRGVEVTAWGEIVGLRIVGPRFSGRWWAVLQGVVELVAPVQLRSRRTRVDYETARHGWRFAEVSSVNRHRFGYRHLDAFETLVDTLGEEGQLQLLAEDGFMGGALAALPRHTSWITPLTHRRVRAAVRRLLAAVPE